MGRLKPGLLSLLERKPRVIRLDERTGDSEAAYDLAVTTHRFSSRARAMVDDKLSASAALMRAGEVTEAQRLLAEAEQDLLAEEGELLRQIEELDTYRSLHQQQVVVVERPTRGSLMRTVAVAAASSAVLALATMGGQVMGLFEPNSPIPSIQASPTIDRLGVQQGRSIRSTSARRGVAVRINGVKVVLTRAEWRALKRAQRSGDEEAINDLLDVIAPELTASAPTEVVEIVAGAVSVINEVAQQAARGADDEDVSDDSTDDGGEAPSSESPPSEEPADETDPPPSDDDGAEDTSSGGSTTDGDGEGTGEGDGGGLSPGIGSLSGSGGAGGGSFAG
jgi:hypothetical protein